MHVDRALIDSLETSLSNSREQVMNLIRERDEARERLAAAEAARGIAEQQLTVICDGVNRRCGKGPNELPLVSMDGVVKERDEFRQLLREVLRGRRRFMRDSLGKELYEAVEKAGGVE